MPAEKTLNDPLCGAEIKQIIVGKIADALDRDCTLQDDVCYPGFSVNFELKLTYVRSITPGTLVWGSETVLPDPENVGEVVDEKVTGDYKTDSPNTAREENDLPIPVMVNTHAGPRREKVRFKRPELYAKKK
jgi:hypothetical protein